MGRLGAALGLGAALAVAAYAGWAVWDDQRAWPYAAFLMASALTLLFGGTLSLFRIRGGLRLLAGAWGVMVGVAAQNALTHVLDASPPPSLSELVSEANAEHILLTQSWLAFSVGPLLLLSLVGMVLVVAHRE